MKKAYSQTLATCRKFLTVKTSHKRSTSVFNTDSCEELPPCDVTCSTEMDNITIDVEDIKKRLNNLNVYKSYGPDMLHPRILKELKNEIALPLKLIFECSLATKMLPEDWKLGNITPIFKKGKKVVLITIGR